MSRFIILILICFSALYSYAEPDVAAAEKLAATLCIACHGPEGKSTNPLWPNLYGQKEQYVLAQLKSFKSGVRKNELMSPISMTLSNKDMENLAAYFGRLGSPVPAAAPVVAPTTEESAQ